MTGHHVYHRKRQVLHAKGEGAESLSPFEPHARCASMSWLPNPIRDQVGDNSASTAFATT